MKTLFIAISLAAIAYLALQTDTVRTAVSSLITKVSEDNQQPRMEEEQDRIIPSDAALIKQLTALSTQTSNENKTLIARVDQLEASILTLESKLDKPSLITATRQANDHMLSATIFGDRVNNTKALAANQRDGVPLAAHEKVTAFTKQTMAAIVDAGQVAREEQQKRIQQQAILRALSQKMELAALNGLLN
jgi:hypothetical protein